MQQAARVSQLSAMFHLGLLVEENGTDRCSPTPDDQRTQDYIMGRRSGASIRADTKFRITSMSASHIYRQRRTEIPDPPHHRDGRPGEQMVADSVRALIEQTRHWRRRSFLTVIVMPRKREIGIKAMSPLRRRRFAADLREIIDALPTPTIWSASAISARAMPTRHGHSGDGRTRNWPAASTPERTGPDASRSARRLQHALRQGRRPSRSAIATRNRRRTPRCSANST